jgi:hypothetical protein
MALPNFWELSFRNTHPDTRMVAEVYERFEQFCWLYEVHVHHIARFKLKKWLEDEGWMQKTCHEMLFASGGLGYDSRLRRHKGLGGGSGAYKVLHALTMFMTYTLATMPAPKQEDYEAFYKSFQEAKG